MPHLLKQDDGVSVFLDGNIVRKTVKGYNSSRFCDRVGPKEMVDREVRALEMVEGIYVVPKLIERVSDDTILIEHIPSTSLRQCKRILTNEYFDNLSRITEECEDRGVYRIGDRRRDFLVMPNNHPAIIDFGNVLFEDDYDYEQTQGMIAAIKYFRKERMEKLRKRFVP